MPQMPREKALLAGEFVSARTISLIYQLLVLAAVIALAVPVAMVAILEGAGEIPLPFNLHIVDLRLPAVFKIHMLASGLALLLIPAAIALRRRPQIHKPVARAASLAVIAGGLSSFPVAVLSDSVTVARVGFFAQGLVWMSLLGLGIYAVRTRQIALHQRAMLAMGAVATGAIWVRLITAVAVKSPESFNAVYGLSAWAAWLVPLALAWRYGDMLLAPRLRRI